MSSSLSTSSYRTSESLSPPPSASTPISSPTLTRPSPSPLPATCPGLMTNCSLPERPPFPSLQTYTPVHIASTPRLDLTDWTKNYQTGTNDRGFLSYAPGTSNIERYHHVSFRPGYSPKEIATALVAGFPEPPRYHTISVTGRNASVGDTSLSMGPFAMLWAVGSENISEGFHQPKQGCPEHTRKSPFRRLLSSTELPQLLTQELVRLEEWASHPSLGSGLPRPGKITGCFAPAREEMVMDHQRFEPFEPIPDDDGQRSQCGRLTPKYVFEFFEYEEKPSNQASEVNTVLPSPDSDDAYSGVVSPLDLVINPNTLITSTSIPLNAWGKNESFAPFSDRIEDHLMDGGCAEGLDFKGNYSQMVAEAINVSQY